jgi:hypothetical protein
VQYLRSPAVCTPFPGFLTLLSYITASSSSSRTTTAAALMICAMALAFNILHCRIIISIRAILVRRQVRYSLLYINVLAL